MTKQYVEKRENCYYIVGSRLLLDCIVYAFLEGLSPESIVESFPTATLEEVYGALAFYLANRAEIDEYLAEGEREQEKFRQTSRADNPLLFRRLQQAKRSAELQKQK